MISLRTLLRVAPAVALIVASLAACAPGHRPRSVSPVADSAGTAAAAQDAPASGTASATPSANRAGTPPVPGNLHVTDDDRYATITWDGYAAWGPSPSPAGVGGYKVTFGRAGGPRTSFLTQYPAANVQPLTPGTIYDVDVQSVAFDGKLSAPATTTVASDSRRVDALRAQMTGFFDDFNRPEGAVDATKWNVATSLCSDPTMSGMFINAQFHTHSIGADAACDRGEVVSRPRAAFEFSNRTGTIAFDFDGSFDRDEWYLDLLPELSDITGHVAIDGGTPESPATMLRLDLSNNVLRVQLAAGDGVLREVVNSNDLRTYGIQTVPNVRLPWLVKLSQAHIAVTIAGKTVVDSAIRLPFSTATVQFTMFNYNSAKENKPQSLQHWDTFGFDGPAPAVVTHSYAPAAAAYTQLGPGAAQRDIVLPDSLAGATGARLMYVLQADPNQTYTWSPGQQAKLDGVSYPIPQPHPPSGGSLVNDYRPYSVVVPVNPSTLKTGANTLSFSQMPANVLDVHVEIDFPASNAPAYTPPAFTMPMMVADHVGPGAVFTRIGATETWTFMSGVAANTEPKDQAAPLKLAGVVPLAYEVQSNVALSATGKIPGIAKVQILVDGKSVQALTPDSPVPSLSGEYNLDTTALANGRHTLEVVATDANGVASIPDYFESDLASGDHEPVYITVANPARRP